MNQLQGIEWVGTSKGLTITQPGEKPVTIWSGTNKYKNVLKLLIKGKLTEALEFIIPKKRIEKFSKGDFTIKDNNVVETSTNKSVPNIITRRLLEFSDNNFSYRALKKFWENLKKNPNPHSVTQLYGFLDKFEVPITEEGCFIAYKYVTKCDDGHLKDSYSRTFINDVGYVVAMDRNKCDSNPKQTCSHGLHVAEFSYAKECGSGQVIIEVKVNPKDVVAVPDDYNQRKMRVCRYEVIRMGEKECHDSYKNLKKKFYSKKDIEVKTASGIDIFSMTAQEIVNYVMKKTNIQIKLSLKNKKSIIKKATEILSDFEKMSTKEHEKIDLSELSAKEIVDKVFEQTGETITLSLKNKKSIVKRAQNIFTKHGLATKI
jgi:hypothetical protein